MEDLVEVTSEARRVNWRASRWSEAADRREEQARALQRLTGCVDEIMALVGDARSPVHADDRIAALLRSRTTAALRAVAEMLRTVHDDNHAADEPEAATAAAKRADYAVSELAEEAGRAAAAGARYLPAAAISVTLRQAVEAWS